MVLGKSIFFFLQITMHCQCKDGNNFVTLLNLNIFVLTCSGFSIFKNIFFFESDLILFMDSIENEEAEIIEAKAERFSLLSQNAGESQVTSCLTFMLESSSLSLFFFFFKIL